MIDSLDNERNLTIEVSDCHVLFQPYKLGRPERQGFFNRAQPAPKVYETLRCGRDADERYDSIYQQVVFPTRGTSFKFEEERNYDNVVVKRSLILRDGLYSRTRTFDVTGLHHGRLEMALNTALSIGPMNSASVIRQVEEVAKQICKVIFGEMTWMWYGRAVAMPQSSGPWMLVFSHEFNGPHDAAMIAEFVAYASNKVEGARKAIGGDLPRIEPRLGRIEFSDGLISSGALLFQWGNRGSDELIPWRGRG